MSAPTSSPTPSVRQQYGLTLVELMISITLGLLVVLAATAMLVSSKSTYTMQDDDSVVRDTGRYAIENITRSLRQAAFENWDTETATNNITQAPIVTLSTMGANLAGLDASTLGSDSTAGMAPVVTTGIINGSDVLAVRFFGVGSKKSGSISKDGFGSIIDCAGFGVSGPTSQDTADADRGWSIYYVALDASGEPQLRCKYRGQKSDGSFAWSSEAIARGVESFQVLYGVDTDNDRIPNRFLTATEINALDEADKGKEANKNKTLNEFTNWKKVQVIKIALLVRGNSNVQGDTSSQVFHLFGEAYSSSNSTDSGTKVAVSSLDASVQKRVRKVFLETIQLRNASGGSGT